MGSSNFGQGHEVFKARINILSTYTSNPRAYAHFTCLPPRERRLLRHARRGLEAEAAAATTTRPARHPIKRTYNTSKRSKG